MILWRKVSFREEESEFDRLASDLAAGLDDEVWNFTFNYLKKLYSKSSLKELSESIWTKLQNTDSNSPNLSIEQALYSIKENSLSSGTRDFDKVMDEIRNGKPRAPIIAKINKKYTLVAGNTRLMACRVLKVRPKVILMEIKL